jgi:glycosyltransferase involved in cell wall biosynthesis
MSFISGGAAGQYTIYLGNALSKVGNTMVITPNRVSPWHFIRRVNADVVHVSVEYRFWFPYALILHQKYPLVVTIHDPKAMDARNSVTANKLAALVQYVNNSLIARIADKVIVHSEKMKDCTLISRLPRHKVEVVPIGNFEFPAFSKEAVEDSKNILFFGRIIPYKGLEYLIQAGKVVEQQIPDVTITIAGAGDFSKYEKLVAGDKHFIVHNRFIPDNEVANLFQKASLVVLPYTHGTQTGVISAAASFKKPAIVTDVGNFSEVVEHGKTGLVVPPRSPYILADAMVTLLKNDKLRQEMGCNAHEVMKKYSWDNMAKQTLEVYRKAIDEFSQRKHSRS